MKWVRATPVPRETLLVNLDFLERSNRELHKFIYDAGLLDSLKEWRKDADNTAKQK